MGHDYAVLGRDRKLLWPFALTALRDFTAFALKIQLLVLPVVGFQIVVGNYFQATGQPMKSIILSLTRQVLFLIPLYIVLPIVLPMLVPTLTGLDALYFAVPIADGLSVVAAAAFLAFEMRPFEAR